MDICASVTINDMANTEEKTYKQQLDQAAKGESASTTESATKLVDTVIDKGMSLKDSV